MSTPDELVQAGRLERFTPDLLPGELECRRIFMMPRVVNFFMNKLPGLEPGSAAAGAMTPVEQADEQLTGFVRGDEAFRMPPHSMVPEKKGVWELRTSDLRFFGWFWRPGTFILSAVASVVELKKWDLYDDYRDLAIKDRNDLNLDPPPFITGKMSYVL